MKHFTSFIFALVAMFCMATSASAALDTSKTYYLKSSALGLYASVPATAGNNVTADTSEKSELIFTAVAGGYSIKDASNGKYIGVDSWNCVASTTPVAWEVTETEGGYYIKNTTGDYAGQWLGGQNGKTKFYNNNPAQVLIVLEEAGTAPVGPEPEPEPEVNPFENVALHNLAGDYLCIGSEDMNVSSTEFKWDLNAVSGLTGAYQIKQNGANWWVNSGSNGRLSKANSTGNARHFYFYEVTAKDATTLSATLVEEPEIGKDYVVGVSNVTPKYHGFYVVYGQLATTTRLDVIKINESAVDGSTIALIPESIDLVVNVNVDSNNTAITSLDKAVWTLEGEVPVGGNINVTYTYTFNGKTLYSETVKEIVGNAPTKATFPTYVTASGYPETISGSTFAYTIETTIADLPFEFGKYYYIDEWAVSSRHYFLYANSSSDKLRETKQATATGDVSALDASRLREYLWTVDGDWYNGFTFCNKLGYFMQAPSANPTNGVQVSVTDTEDALCRFDIFKQATSGKYSYRPHGGSNCIAHTSDGNLIPGFYNAYTDGNLEATTFTYIEYVPNWTAFEALLTKLENIPFGEGLGEYSVNAVETGFGTLTVSLITDYLKNGARPDFESRDVDYYDYDMDIMTMFNENIAINLPKAGSFLRMKGHNSQKYVYADAASEVNHTTGNIGASNCLPMGDLTGNEATSIFFYDGSHMISYKSPNYSGLYMYQSGLNKNLNDASGLDTYEWFEGVTAGTYRLHTTKANSNLYDFHADNGRTNRWSTADNARTCFDLEAVEELPVSVSAAGYATLYAPVALTIPAGVEAYTLTEEGDYLLAATVETTIPANTAVVLKAAQDTHNFAITTSEAFTGQNVLTGTIPTIAKVDGALVLGLDEENNVGFYSLKEEVANLAGFKAYYVPTSSESNFRISFGELTSIISAAQQNGGQAIFDLQGRRVVNAQNGLFIQNGKKVIR